MQSSVVILTSSGEVLEASLIDKRGFKSACPGSHNLQAAESWGEAVLTCFLTRAKGALCISWLLSVPAVMGVEPAPCAHCALPLQIKRRASEALPELLRPVTPITNLEGTLPQDPSGIFGLVSNLEQLDVDDWEF